MVKRCFKIWHAVKFPLQKRTKCIKLTKKWLILKILTRIWRFVKNLFQNQILFQSFDRITVFFSISSKNCWFLRKRIAAIVGFFLGKLIQSDLSEAEFLSKSLFIQIEFTSKSDALQNFWFRNLTRSKIFDSKFPELWKNGSKSDAFEILDSRYDALYNKWFKTDYFQKFWSKKIFKKKNNFLRNNFSKNAQKANFDVFMV